MVMQRMKRVGARWSVVLPTVLAVGCGSQVSNSVANGNAAQQAPSGQAQGGAPAMNLDDAYRALETAQGALPRQRFDPAAAVQLIGNDPVKIFEWVRDNTDWVPYRGALRGPAGVLMDGLGNSLDRSLLLAELLRLAGHDVRLVRGAIDARVGKELLARVRTAAVVTPAASPRPDEEFAQMANRLHLDRKRIDASLEELRANHLKNVASTKERVDSQVPSLAKSVGEPAIAPDAARLEEHWWVQRRSGSQWEDLDVLTPDARPGQARLQASEFFDINRATGRVDLGAQNRHDLTIRVVVEQWKAGKTAKYTILEHKVFPAELNGQTLLLGHVPVGQRVPDTVNLAQEPGAGIRALAMAPTEWLPILRVGNDQVYQQSVNARGERNAKPNLDTNSSAPTPPKGFSVGFDALGGGAEAPSDDGQFTAEWVEYEINAPGAKPRIVRREIFDLLLPEERAGQTAPVEDDARRLARGLSLMGSVQILAQASRLAPEFAVQKAVAETLANRQAMAALQKALKSGAEVVSLDPNQPLTPTSEHLHDLAVARFAWSPVGGDVYIASSNVLTYRRTLWQNPEGKVVSREGFDIVANGVRVRPQTPQSAFLTQLAQGTADTNVEALLLKDARFNAGAALGSSVPPQLLTLRAAPDVTRLGPAWPGAARALVGDALAAGYVVIVSNPQASERTPPTWWRVDPKTGETLGMGPDGWGQGMTEKAAVVLVILMSTMQVFTLVTVITYQLCVAIGNVAKGQLTPEEDRRCKCEAVDTGINAAGVAGGAVSAAVGMVFPLLGWVAGTVIGGQWVIQQIIKAAACAN